MTRINLENDFYKQVRVLAKGHDGITPEIVDRVLKDAKLYLAELPARRAFAIIQEWLNEETAVSP